MTAQALVCAASSFSLSSAESRRAFSAIQKIIQVTKPTEMMDREPPIASCASKVRVSGPKVSSAPKLREMMTATATPNHMGVSRWVRFVLRM